MSIVFNLVSIVFNLGSDGNDLYAIQGKLLHLPLLPTSSQCGTLKIWSWIWIRTVLLTKGSFQIFFFPFLGRQLKMGTHDHEVDFHSLWTASGIKIKCTALSERCNATISSHISDHMFDSRFHVKLCFRGSKWSWDTSDWIQRSRYLLLLDLLRLPKPIEAGEIRFKDMQFVSSLYFVTVAEIDS